MIRKAKLFEFVRFDSKLCSFVLFAIYLFQYILIRIRKGNFEALIIAGKCFRHTQIRWVRNIAVTMLKLCIKKYGVLGVGQQVYNIVNRNVNSTIIEKLRESVLNRSSHPFDNRLLILSSPVNDQNGVILFKFTDYFQYALNLFDIKKLTSKYILIVEPSYSGYFDENILCLLSVDAPIIIESPEPVDYKFIHDISTNLIPVNIGANCWVNNQTFFPIRPIQKKYDVVMVAIWADFKRHYHLFESLSKCKEEKKIALIGKPWPKTSNDIMDEARYYGVLNQITFFEDITQNKINLLINESKCFLLLSRREGINKAIIESMYADTPAFILTGFNYGHKYNYINSKTGGFIDPKNLTEFLDNLDDIIKNGHFTPNSWISKNLSPEKSNLALIDLLKKIENNQSCKINKNLHIKVNSPELNYYDGNTKDVLHDAYNSLSEYLK